MLRLERDQTQIVTEASAATAASTAIACAVISDAVTRITLEGRADQLEQQRLPPP